jgi:2-iminobutanoate/2-iminopropanoate deaminase
MENNIIETNDFKLPAGLPFSKAIKKGGHLYISGTAAFNEKGEFVGKGNVYKQTQQTLQNILALVKKAGGTKEHIAKINIYLKSISDYEVMNQAYTIFFDKAAFPARTTVEANLVYEDFLVEIDAEAIIE